MGLRERAEISVGGPDGQSTWGDEGDSFTLQNHAVITSVTTTATIFPAQTITRPNSTIAGGLVAPDSLAAGMPIQTWSGLQLSNGSVAQAAAANLSLYFQIYRNLGLGLAISSGIAITSVTTGAPILAPIPSGATLTATNPAGTTQAFTTSALAPVGSTIIPVNSVTPGANYAVGTPGAMSGSTLITLVGNMGAFGWLAPATGTPVFPANGSVVTPAITANTAVVNGQLPVAASDNLQVVLVTSSGTVSNFPILNCQPMLV